MMKILLETFGVHVKDRFGEGWSGSSVIATLATLFVWYIRGCVRRLFFRKFTGIVLIGRRVAIRYPRHLTVGKNFIAEDNCEINCLSRKGITFGNKVTVGKFALIRPSNIYGGDIGEGLVVGDNSNIGPFSYIGCSGFIEIGKNVMISPRVSLYAENHIYDSLDLTMKEQGVKRSFVRIEDDCWIAANSVILSGVTIGRGSVVAAGAVVTRDVPPFSVVAGVPAKIVKSRKNNS